MQTPTDHTYAEESKALTQRQHTSSHDHGTTKPQQATINPTQNQQASLRRKRGGSEDKQDAPVVGQASKTKRKPDNGTEEEKGF